MYTGVLCVVSYLGCSALSFLIILFSLFSLLSQFGCQMSHFCNMQPGNMPATKFSHFTSPKLNTYLENLLKKKSENNYWVTTGNKLSEK